MTETDMDAEHLLICRILTAPEDWTPLAASPVRESFFHNPRHRDVYCLLRDYHSRYHAVPDLRVVRQTFPREIYRVIRVTMPIADLIDRVCASHKAALLEQGLESAVTAWEQGHFDAAEHALSATTSRLHTALPVAEDMDLAATGDERLAWYLERTERPEGLLGLPTGLKALDTATNGLQAEQLVTFTGFAKHGKSFLMLDVARAVHLSGSEPLFLGFEMSNREQGERFDSSRAAVSLARLRDGSLDEREWAKLERAVRSLADMQRFVLSADRSSTMTLSGIAAKLDQVRPSVLFVDGVYMMEDENGESKGSPQALTNLTRGFKRLAQAYKIPVVISTQSLEWKADRKKGLTRASIGYSSSFIQDSDVIIGVETSQEDPAVQIVKVLASRNCPPQDAYIRRDWDQGSFQELDYNPFEEDGPAGEDDDLLAY